MLSSLRVRRQKGLQVGSQHHLLAGAQARLPDEGIQILIAVIGRPDLNVNGVLLCLCHSHHRPVVHGVEDHAAQHDAADASPFGLREVFEEGTALGPDASHREAQENGEEHHADHVIPVEKLVTPGLAGEFLGVSPRAPAEHRDEAEDDCQRVAVNNEHSI